MANRVTLKETVDSPCGKTLSIDRIRDRRAFDKRTLKKTVYTPPEASLMTAALSKGEPPNKKPRLG